MPYVVEDTSYMVEEENVHTTPILGSIGEFKGAFTLCCNSNVPHIVHYCSDR